jgi:hypothetical protein
METITIVQHNSERLVLSLHIGCSSSIWTTFHDTGLDTTLGRVGVQGRTDLMTKRMGRVHRSGQKKGRRRVGGAPHMDSRCICSELRAERPGAELRVLACR